jgi:hypothetical protein
MAAGFGSAAAGAGLSDVPERNRQHILRVRVGGRELGGATDFGDGRLEIVPPREQEAERLVEWIRPLLDVELALSWLRR